MGIQILIQSVCETMVPKLVAEDIPLLFSLLSDVFPGIEYNRAQMTQLKEHIRDVSIQYNRAQMTQLKEHIRDVSIQYNRAMTQLNEHIRDVSIWYNKAKVTQLKKYCEYFLCCSTVHMK